MYSGTRCSARKASRSISRRGRTTARTDGLALAAAAGERGIIAPLRLPRPQRQLVRRRVPVDGQRLALRLQRQLRLRPQRREHALLQPLCRRHTDHLEGGRVRLQAPPHGNKSLGAHRIDCISAGAHQQRVVYSGTSPAKNSFSSPALSARFSYGLNISRFNLSFDVAPGWERSKVNKHRQLFFTLSRTAGQLQLIPGTSSRCGRRREERQLPGRQLGAVIG